MPPRLRPPAAGRLRRQPDRPPPPPGGTLGGEADLNAELGVGSLSADAELDAAKEAAEGQLLAGLLAPYARLVEQVGVVWFLSVF